MVRRESKQSCTAPSFLAQSHALLPYSSCAEPSTLGANPNTSVKLLLSGHSNRNSNQTSCDHSVRPSGRSVFRWTQRQVQDDVNASAQARGKGLVKLEGPCRGQLEERSQHLSCSTMVHRNGWTEMKDMSRYHRFHRMSLNQPFLHLVENAINFCLSASYQSQRTREDRLSLSKLEL